MAGIREVGQWDEESTRLDRGGSAIAGQRAHSLDETKISGGDTHTMPVSPTVERETGQRRIVADDADEIVSGRRWRSPAPMKPGRGHKLLLSLGRRSSGAMLTAKSRAMKLHSPGTCENVPLTKLPA